MQTTRLIQWDRIEVRISGEKIAAMAGEIIREKQIPIQELHFTFGDGELVVEGKARKGISIPFRAVIDRIESTGNRISVHLRDLATFGFLPVPKLLMQLVQQNLKHPLLSFDAQRNVVELPLDRLLPSFVDVEVREVHIIRGGIGVVLGEGGADPPIPMGGSHGANT